MSTNMPQLSSALLCEQVWTRRFTAWGRRLSEATELYRQLGYEVRLEPVNPNEEETAGAEACKDCFVIAQARTIFTRPVNPAR